MELDRNTRILKAVWGEFCHTVLIIILQIMNLEIPSRQSELLIVATSLLFLQNKYSDHLFSPGFVTELFAAVSNQ